MSNEWLMPGLVLAGRVTLVLALALLTTSLMRRTSAAARHFVWLLATVAVLLMPVLSLAIPEWRVVPGLSWLRATPPASSVSRAPAAAVPAAVPAATVRGESVAPRAADGATRVRAVEAADVGTGTGSGTVEAAAVSVDDGGAVPPAAKPGGGPARSMSWPLLALMVWAVGAALRMAYVLAGHARIRQVARSSRRVRSGRLVDAVREVAREFGIARRVRVFTRGDAMPITWGFLHPGVLLPEVAGSWSTTRLQAVLRHELAHVARADALTQMLAEWMCAVHWYNPLAWLTGSRLRAEREHACDDLVVLRGARASDYADELLDLARSYGRSAIRAHAAMAMARRSTLNARLRALLDEGRSRSRVGGRTAAAFTGIAALVVLPLSGIAPTRAPVRPMVPDSIAAGVPASPIEAVAPGSPAAGLADASLPESVTIPAESTGAADNQQEATCLQRRRTGHNSMSVTGRDGVYRLSYDRGDCDGEVRIRGELRFNDDFTRLVGISRGGSVRMEENYGRESRRLDKEQPFDAAGQQWLSAMLVGMFRQMGFMAEERALSILQRQGVEGLLREASLLDSDHVQWQYLKVAIERGHLDDAGVRRVLDMAGRTLDSDHYLASLLTAVADDFQFNDATRDAFLKAAGTLESDHYRHQVLTAVLTKGDLTPAQVATVLDYSAAIESDHYRAGVLMSVADRYGMNAAVRAAYLKAAQEIDSDHYKAQVLDKLLAGSKLAPDQVAEVIAAASSIQSDTYLAGILNKIDVASLTSPALQQAFLRAASTLDSDHYMHEVLVHYLDERTLSPAQLSFVLTAAKQIDSDHYLADVMIRIAQKYPLKGDTRQQFLHLLDSIESDHYHGEVASALLRGQGG
jgi:beta-lactamase regulating signal transducer with metallopeptidase domain